MNSPSHCPLETDGIETIVSLSLPFAPGSDGASESIRLIGSGRASVIGFLSLALALISYAAPTYELESAGVTGGGGVASGGVYRLVGTVVPATAGEAAAGPYELITISLVTDLGVGGEPTPSLKATLVPGGILISWPVGEATFHLQETPALPPTLWKDNNVAPVVVGAENQVTIPPSPDARFFRLERR